MLMFDLSYSFSGHNKVLIGTLSKSFIYNFSELP